MQGEWWIQDGGFSVFADGDIGDQNHEGIAFDSALSLDGDIQEKLEITANGFDINLIARTFLEENNIELEEPSLDELPEIGWQKLVQELDVSTENAARPRAEALAYQFLENSGANMKFVEWFQKESPADVREYALENMSWIRVKGSNFEVWKFDEATLKSIRQADFWDQQEDTDDEKPLEESEDEIYIEERSTGEGYSVKLKNVFDESIPIEGLKAISLGGEWAPPKSEPVRVFPKHTTDGPGPDGRSWIYRRIGDNPKSRKKESN